MHAAQAMADWAAMGLAHCVVSPGSRSAPLVLAASRLGLHTHVAADERAAAYMALGLSLATGRPAAAICTSGTAALNFLPAAAEALLSEIPLLLLSADRPPEWIGQQDGQAVFQQHAFGPHAKAAFQFPTNPAHPDELWHCRRLAQEAWQAATTGPQGPVHVNIPLREPFYPKENEVLEMPAGKMGRRIIATPPQLERHVLVHGQQHWERQARRLIVAGQMPFNIDLQNALKALLEYAPDCVLLYDASSNLHGLRHLPNALPAAWVDLCSPLTEALQPDLVVHLGGAITSRRLRNWLRSCPAPPKTNVWRVQSYAYPAPDTFQHLSDVVVADPTWLITKLAEHSFFQAREASSYSSEWATAFEGIQNRVNSIPKGDWNEALAVQQALEALTEGTTVHFSNSLPIRWAGWLDALPALARTWTNRGASGIDGCTSTAVGYALARREEQVLLVTGDTAFFYDRNGLWLQGGVPSNLKILILNNGGGAIFSLIDGPGSLPEKESLFVNPHSLSAQNTAADFGLGYFSAKGLNDWPAALDAFQKYDGACILEAFVTVQSAEAARKSLLA